MAVFQIQARDASLKNYGIVEAVTMQLLGQDCPGQVYFTDLLADWVGGDWLGWQRRRD
jgi:hypothetical protein